MKYNYVQIADVGIRLMHDWAQFDLYRLLDPIKGPITATLAVRAFEGEYRRHPILNGDILCIESREGFDVLKHLGYLVHLFSREFRYCHGTGFEFKDRGILLLGNSGTGKTSLALNLKGQPISDDAILVNENEMRRIGYPGTIGIPDENLMAWTFEGPTHGPIDYVFLLKKDKEPANAVEHLGGVSPTLTFDDNFSQQLLPYYSLKGPASFKAPIFEIGTNGNLDKTVKLIEDIVS